MSRPVFVAVYCALLLTTGCASFESSKDTASSNDDILALLALLPEHVETTSSSSPHLSNGGSAESQNIALGPKPSPVTASSGKNARPHESGGPLKAATPFAAIAHQDLGQVVTQAISSNPRIIADLESFRAAGEEQRQDRGRLLPEVNIQGQAGREWRTGSRQDPSSENWNRTGYNLNIRQLIYDGNSTRNTVRQLGFEKLALYYDLLTTVHSVARESTEAYIDLYRYRQLIAMAEENYGIHERTLKLLEERLASGVGKGVDTEQAAGRLALAQTNLMTESNNLNNVLQRYRRVVGEFPPDGLQPIPQPPVPKVIGRQDFLAALARNPDLLAQQSTVQAAGASVDAARGNFSPTVELRASSGSDRDNPTSSTYGAYNNRVELVLNYNLYRGGSDTARLKQTIAQTQSAKKVRDYTCRNLQQDLASTWNDIQRLRAQLPFLRKHEASMEKVSIGAEQQFEIGQRSLLDLLDTANELFDSRRARVNGEFDLLQLEYRWLALSSQLLSALGLSEPVGHAPPESSEILLPEDILQACATQAPDTRNLTPLSVVYDEGDRPPTVAPLARRLDEPPAPGDQGAGKDMTK